MKAKKLLETHDQNSASDSLTDCLGDGYLFLHNRVYRNIRLAAVGFGFRFSSEFDLDYLSFPFSQLERVLQQKLIPYIDNVSILEKLVDKLNDNLNWKELNDGYRRNFIFHESCHAVARSLNSGNLPPPSSENQLAVRSLFEESFSNACEFIAAVEAEDPIHKIFYQLNSYTSLFEYRHLLKSLISDLGEDFVFKYLILSYLHSNFLRNNLSPLDQERIAEISNSGSSISIDAKTKKWLLTLSRIAFTLDVDFRTLTTGLHLKLLGILDSKVLYKIDFMKTFELDDSYSKALHTLCQYTLKNSS